MSYIISCSLYSDYSLNSFSLQSLEVVFLLGKTLDIFEVIAASIG